MSTASNRAIADARSDRAVARAGGVAGLLALVLVATPGPTLAQPARANYDEAKVPAYTLPDPLRFVDGGRVRTAGEWTKRRRPEVLRLFGDPRGNSAVKTLGAALTWVRKDGSRPFFLLVHTYEVHSYFLGKPAHHAFARRELPTCERPFREWRIRDLTKPAGPQVIDALLGASEDDVAYVCELYRGALAELDAEIGRFAEGLAGAGLDGRTVIALTSTNGEGFRPDRKRVHHGGRLHDDVLDVPLFLRWPGRLLPGVSGALVSTLDVAPTLVRLAGLAAEPRFAGRSLVAADTSFLSNFRGPRFLLRTLPSQPAVAQEATFRILPSGRSETATAPQLALYSEWLSLIADGDRVELYDLKADPRQEKDLAAQHPDVTASLREQLRRLAEGAGRAGSGPDAAQLEQLRSLGYVQ
jgi:arylsulfatase A-like enzyme